MGEKEAIEILKGQGMTQEEAEDFIAGIKRGLEAIREGGRIPWDKVKKELALMRKEVKTMAAETMEQVEDRLVRKLCSRNGWEYGDNEDYDNAVRDVKWFLSQPEILVKDPDQMLPPNPYGAARNQEIFHRATSEFVKENWVKVIPKGKKGGEQNGS